MRTHHKSPVFCLFLLGILVSCTPAIRRPKAPDTLVMPPSVIEKFRTECDRLIEEKPGGAPQYSVGRDGWCYQISELKFARSGPFFGADARKVFPKAGPQEADPINAILDFRKQLSERGIELFFVPIPVRPAIYPEGVIPLGKYKNAEPLPDIQPVQDDFLSLLDKAGVETINLDAYFLANRHHERGPLFCRSDTHWTPSGAQLAAEIVASWLKTSPWYEDVPSLPEEGPGSLTTRRLEKEYSGHCYRKLREVGSYEKGLPEEKISFRKIFGKDINGEGDEILRHKDAPVVVIGDSNLIVWHDIHAGFSQELSYELGFFVDTIQTAGGGSNECRLDLSREIQKDPHYLDGKKAVVWTYTARAEIGAKPYWIKIPIEPSGQR